MTKALVIFSGGQDSTTCLYWAKQRYDNVVALSFDYGQRHSIELESAAKISRLAGVDHEIINLGPVFAGLSPLTDKSQEVESFQSVDELPDSGIATTFVPGRNILFLTVAANRAYVIGADTMVIGVAQQDFGGYPDCREDFIQKMEAAINSGLEANLKIETPLMHLSKKETVELAATMDGCMEALAHSTTCYRGQIPPCGNCHSCILRQKGFAQASIADPLLSALEGK